LLLLEIWSISTILSEERKELTLVRSAGSLAFLLAYETHEVVTGLLGLRWLLKGEELLWLGLSGLLRLFGSSEQLAFRM